MVLSKEMGSLVGCLVLPTATSPSSMEPIQPLDFMDSGGLDAAIALSPEVVGQVASVGAEDDELGRLLASLDATCPGSGKAVACLLVEEGSTGKVKKVKKALRAIGKKSGAIGKASAAV